MAWGSNLSDRYAGTPCGARTDWSGVGGGARDSADEVRRRPWSHAAQAARAGWRPVADPVPQGRVVALRPVRDEDPQARGTAMQRMWGGALLGAKGLRLQRQAQVADATALGGRV